jgi:hypothetical protein
LRDVKGVGPGSARGAKGVGPRLSKGEGKGSWAGFPAGRVSSWAGSSWAGFQWCLPPTYDGTSADIAAPSDHTKAPTEERHKSAISVPRYFRSLSHFSLGSQHPALSLFRIFLDFSRSLLTLRLWRFALSLVSLSALPTAEPFEATTRTRTRRAHLRWTRPPKRCAPRSDADSQATHLVALGDEPKRAVE